jgi:diguanylate cyclase
MSETFRNWSPPANLFSLDVLVWILPVVLISIAIGWIMGRSYALRNLNRKIRGEREQALNVLQTIVQGAEQLTSDVDTHNSELASVGRTVCDIEAGQEYRSIQKQLLGHIAEVIESNKRMEDDLVVTKYRLEKQAQELDRTRREARTDTLSGVANRKAFDEALQFSISNLKRNKTPFALLLMDVDHFKRINDTHGHQAGDHVVMRLGEAFKTHVRPTDFVGRYGGDEFAILLTGVVPDMAGQVADRIRDSIQKTNFEFGDGASQIAVTLSMGLACADSEVTSGTVFERADQALYKSKHSGRNKLTVWSADDAGTPTEAALTSP